MPSNTNHNRTTNLHTLLIQNPRSIQISNSPKTRCKKRPHNTIYAHKRSIPILHPSIRTHRTRSSILLTKKQKRSVINRTNTTSNSNSNSVPRICTTMRSNIILRSHRNYQHLFSNSIHGKINRRMDMRKLLSITTNTNPIFFPTFHHPNSNRINSDNPPNVTSRKRILKPNMLTNKHRQGTIPPILLHKRRDTNNHSNNTNNNNSEEKPKHIRRPRKL